LHMVCSQLRGDFEENVMENIDKIYLIFI